MSDFLRAFTKPERTMEFIKMKKIALFSVIALSALMVGCSSTQKCDTDSKACGTAQCGTADCDPSTCEKPGCDKKAACPLGAKKACGADCTKPCCANKKACGADCTKPCCANKQACAHPNTTFACPKCKDGKACCADCAAKAAAGCPDCKVG